MPTIKDKIRFNFDGKWSDEYGIMNVVLDSGMHEETFIATREINETTRKGRNKPLFNNLNETAMEFDMILAFESGFDEDLLDEVVRWLFLDYYRPLYFENAEHKIYYCMAVGESSISHISGNQGYLKIKMRCDSSYIYSPSYLSDEYELVDGITQRIELKNLGHYEIFPEISIEKIGDGNITIVSKSDGDDIFEIRDLKDGEDIYINCEKEIIETNVIGTYRYNNIIGEYPRLLYGKNIFEITGSCKIQFRYKHKYRF